jgi:fructose-1,6-bisphosphatase I
MSELVDVLSALQVSVKVIHKNVNMAGRNNTLSAVGGGMVRKLDVLANECMINYLSRCHQVYVIASEESRDPIVIRDDPGGYAVVIDPLDGSQNIDCNASLGSIFGIYKKTAHGTPGQTSDKDLLKKGSELICSGYAHYGASTTMVITYGAGVHGFLLDPSIGEFLLVRKRISIPRSAPIYSTNESTSMVWDQYLKQFIEAIKTPSKTRKPMKSRYIGTMTADIHRSLLYGGIYLYPGTPQNPNGKVRLLYECNPIAYLMEQAGGKAFTLDNQGKPVRVLDYQPTAVHQKIPFYCGSFEDISILESMYKGMYKPKSKL